MLKPKHILILSSEFPPLPGGIGNHAFNLAKRLALIYAKVTLITDQRTDVQEEALFDNELSFEVIRIKKTSPRFLMYVKRVKEVVAYAKSADIIIATGKFSLWLGALVSQWTKAKTIAVIHGTEVNYKGLLLKQSVDWALVQFNTVIAVSKYTKNLVAHLPLKHIEVIPNAYDPKDWSSVSKDKMNPQKGPNLITVGRLSERKGQLNVIRHLPLLLSDYPEIHYHCVGLAQDLETYQKLAENLGVQDHLSIHGMLSHKALEELYQKMDMAVMLSQITATGDVEGFGIALLEANHYGIPAIGAKDCGIEDAISEGVSGEVVNPKDPNEFKSALENILMNKRHYNQGAKAWAEQHQWQNTIKQYIGYMES